MGLEHVNGIIYNDPHQVDTVHEQIEGLLADNGYIVDLAYATV